MCEQKVLSVGQCRPDSAAITHFLTSNFDVHVRSCDFGDEAIQILRSESVDLVLINRKLDVDGSDGLAVIDSIKSDEQLAATTVMLVSNYAKWQEKAQEIGAAPGCGKAQLSSEVARDHVRAALA